MSALKHLSKDETLIICKPDKGNGVVLTDKKEYVQKMNQLLGDCTKFRPVCADDNITNLASFQRFLYRMSSKKVPDLDAETYQRIRPVAAVTPTLYGLPKIHKDGTPLRPILSSCGSYTYECAKWLTEILTPLRDHPSNLKDTFAFIERIKDQTISNQVMVSFDVSSLFTNIPVDFTIDLIISKVFANGVKKFHGLSKLQLRKMLNWTSKMTTLQFNGSFYQQVDGVAMGSPIAPLLADVCMNWVMDQAAKSQARPAVFVHR